MVQAQEAFKQGASIKNDKQKIKQYESSPEDEDPTDAFAYEDPTDAFAYQRSAYQRRQKHKMENKINHFSYGLTVKSQHLLTIQTTKIKLQSRIIQRRISKIRIKKLQMIQTKNNKKI